MAGQIDILANDIPDIVVCRLLQDPSSITKPRIDRFLANVIFVDISGFTILAETLVKFRSGLVTLTATLGAYFD